MLTLHTASTHHVRIGAPVRAACGHARDYWIRSSLSHRFGAGHTIATSLSLMGEHLQDSASWRIIADDRYARLEAHAATLPAIGEVEFRGWSGQTAVCGLCAYIVEELETTTSGSRPAIRATASRTASSPACC